MGMYFDGGTRHDSTEAGVVLAYPKKHILLYSFELTRLCSNNMVQYQALVLDTQMAIEMGSEDLDVYNDSQLVIKHLLEEYKVKKEDLVLYHKQSLQILIHICQVVIHS